MSFRQTTDAGQGWLCTNAATGSGNVESYAGIPVESRQADDVTMPRALSKLVILVVALGIVAEIVCTAPGSALADDIDASNSDSTTTLRGERHAPAIGPVPATPEHRIATPRRTAIPHALQRPDERHSCVFRGNCPQAPVPTSSNRAVTLTDLADFTPHAATALSEPLGFGIAGLPVNFIASAAPHTVEGRLLGRRAQVRFTPVASDWAYGDGTERMVPNLGLRWAALGLRDLSDTPSSHRFSRGGSYAVTLVVFYAAEYRFDGGDWVAVAGTVRSVAAPLNIRIVAGKSALVESLCSERRDAAGCR